MTEEIKCNLCIMKRCAECKGLNILKKENTELKARIKKMRNCGNCKHFDYFQKICKIAGEEDDEDCNLTRWERDV